MKFVEKQWEGTLVEVDQSLDMEFAFAYEDSKGVYMNEMPFVKCRDFLGDALSAVQDKERKSIYGFYWNPALQRMHRDRLVLVIKFPTDKSCANFHDNFVRFGQEQLAEQCGVEFGHTQLVEPKTILLFAPKFWKSSVVAISLYTYFLKCFGYDLTDQLVFTEAMKKCTVDVKNWDGTNVRTKNRGST